MEKIKVTVVKTTENKEPILYKSSDWELIKFLATNIEIETCYTIYAEDAEEFSMVICHLFNMIRDGSYYDSPWLTKFKKIISKVNQEDKPEEKNKQPKGIMAAYALEKLKEYE